MRAVISRALPRATAAAAVGVSSLSARALAPQGLCHAASGGESIDFVCLLGMDIQTRDYISLKWTDGRISRFHLMHLRSWCLCSECQHETGQRLVNSSDIDPDLEIEDIFSEFSPSRAHFKGTLSHLYDEHYPTMFFVCVVKGSTVNIVWAGSGHKSSFPWSWLRENCYSNATLDQNAKDLTTTMLLPSAPIPTSEYAEVMDTEDDRGLFGLLHQIVENGLAVVQNTPSEKGQVKKIAERIAPVSHSFLYGDIFDVVAEQNPHHLDLAYYESPPGFQFLHALRFDETVRGGESTFVDVFAVAQEFRRLHPKHFETFCRVPATFKKHHLNRSNPAIMEYQRPHIQLNHRDEVIAVHWSPPFEGPLKVPFDDVKPYYEAYKIFHDIVEGGKFLIEFKLKQGDTVIFNQRRVLHGRNQFTADSNGVRHLQGTYINIDDAHCRFNALRYRFAVDDPSIKNRRVANGNFA
ncbi:Gamma-butyrobetaine dioxygenase, partial [Globisporangium splendens]